jgi:hypothetical protein
MRSAQTKSRTAARSAQPFTHVRSALIDIGLALHTAVTRRTLTAPRIQSVEARATVLTRLRTALVQICSDKSNTQSRGRCSSKAVQTAGSAQATAALTGLTVRALRARHTQAVVAVERIDASAAERARPRTALIHFRLAMHSAVTYGPDTQRSSAVNALPSHTPHDCTLIPAGQTQLNALIESVQLPPLTHGCG